VSDKVDALFSSVEHTAPRESAAAITQNRRLLKVAIVLNILGLPCWTSVPGAVLTVWVWTTLDTEVARIQAGEYSDSDAEKLMKLRGQASATLMFCVLCLGVQIALLSTPFYGRLWGSISMALNHLWQGG
jgi:hypothetical protein